MPGISGGSSSQKITNSFSAIGNGAILQSPDSSAFNIYSLSVVATGPVSLWRVVLEVSLTGDEGTYSTILTHTQGDISGSTFFTGPNFYPAFFVRARVVSLSLGLGTSIETTILGDRP